MTISERIEYYREKQGLSKTEVYKHLGMSAPGYDKMILNNSTTAARLEQIATLFNIPVAVFYGENETFVSDAEKKVSIEVEKLSLARKILSVIGITDIQITDFTEEEKKKGNNFVVGTKDKQGNKVVYIDVRAKIEELEQQLNLLKSQINSQNQ